MQTKANRKPELSALVVLQETPKGGRLLVKADATASGTWEDMAASFTAICEALTRAGVNFRSNLGTMEGGAASVAMLDFVTEDTVDRSTDDADYSRRFTWTSIARASA